MREGKGAAEGGMWVEEAGWKERAGLRPGQQWHHTQKDPHCIMSSHHHLEIHDDSWTRCPGFLLRGGPPRIMWLVLKRGL